MTQDLEKVVEKKVNEHLSVIESEKTAADFSTRFFLVLACAFGAFFSSKI